ncbi:MAG TPA: type II secretion system F family protein [Bacillota bacterium]|jgi:Flp pilus assembly protein TadB
MMLEALLAGTAVFAAVYGLIIGLGAGRGLWRHPGGRLLEQLQTKRRRPPPPVPGSMPRGLWPAVQWLPAAVRRRLGERSPEAIDEDDLEESLYALSAALEAGAGLVQALTMASGQCPRAVAAEFRRMVAEFNAGVSLNECLTRARARVSQASFRTLCDTIDIQRSSGGDLRGGLANLAEIIRERRDLRQELKVKTAEARQSAVVLAMIPPVLAGLTWLMKPDLMLPLLTYPAGRLGLGVGLGLWVIGWWMVNRLTKIGDIDGGW